MEYSFFQWLNNTLNRARNKHTNESRTLFLVWNLPVAESIPGIDTAVYQSIETIYLIEYDSAEKKRINSGQMLPSQENAIVLFHSNCSFWEDYCPLKLMFRLFVFHWH